VPLFNQAISGLVCSVQRWRITGKSIYSYIFPFISVAYAVPGDRYQLKQII